MSNTPLLAPAAMIQLEAVDNPKLVVTGCGNPDGAHPQRDSREARGGASAGKIAASVNSRGKISPRSASQSKPLFDSLSLSALFLSVREAATACSPECDTQLTLAERALHQLVAMHGHQVEPAFMNKIAGSYKRYCLILLICSILFSWTASSTSAPRHCGHALRR